MVYLILSAGIKLFKGVKKNAYSIIAFTLTLCALVTLALFSVKFSAIFYILIGGVAGLVIHLVSRLRENKEKEGER